MFSQFIFTRLTDFIGVFMLFTEISAKMGIKFSHGSPLKRFFVQSWLTIPQILPDRKRWNLWISRYWKSKPCNRSLWFSRDIYRTWNKWRWIKLWVEKVRRASRLLRKRSPRSSSSWKTDQANVGYYWDYVRPDKNAIAVISTLAFFFVCKSSFPNDYWLN